MKRMMLAGVLALGAAGPALAADLPPPQIPPPQAPATYVPAPSPEYNWGGIYFGLNGGYGFGDSKWSGLGSTGSFNTDGGLVGVTLGANYQANQMVFGIEGDMDWADASGTAGAGCGASVIGIGTITSCETKNDWLATVRGRLGYAWDRVLLYGTAGGAGGDIKATTSGGTASVGSVDNTEFGWTAGAGVEFALAQNWTARAEYLYVDLSNGSWSCTGAFCGTTSSVSFDESLVRVGLDYKFGGF